MKRSLTPIAGACLALTVAVLGLSACAEAPTARLTSPRAEVPSAQAVPAPRTTPPSPAGTAAPATSPDQNGSASAGGDASRCSIVRNWNTAPDDGGLAMSPADFYRTRVGQHSCYDRVVFDVNGPQPVGFFAHYVPMVTADGSGEAVPVPGQVALEVVVRAWIAGHDDPQAWPNLPRNGDDLIAPSTVSGWKTLLSVVYAGSFEGQTTIGVGVREKRPFRVWTNESDGEQHVILDIAH